MLAFWRRLEVPKTASSVAGCFCSFPHPTGSVSAWFGTAGTTSRWGNGVFCSPEGQVCLQRGHRHCQERGSSPQPFTFSPSPTSLPQDLTALGVHLGTPGRCHLPPGPPRRGWEVWDGSRTCHFSKNSFSFSRVTQISAAWPCILPAWPSHPPRLELPAGEAAKPGSVCSNEHGADGCCCTVLPQNRGHRENRAKEEENRLESNCGGGGDAEGEARIDSCLLCCTLEESLTSD